MPFSSHAWTLWTRQNCQPWECQAQHRPERLQRMVELMNAEYPGLETLILPPGESPRMPKARCHLTLEREEHGPLCFCAECLG